MRKYTLGFVALAVTLTAACLTQAAPILQVDVEHRSTTDLPPDGPMATLYSALLERCVAVEPDDDITLLGCEML